MKKNLFIALALLVLLFAVSCTSLADYYRPSVTTAPVAVLPAGYQPTLEYTNDIDKAASEMSAKGFVEIGRISYAGYTVDDAEKQLLKICSEKQAAVAVYSVDIVEDLNVDYSRYGNTKHWYKAVFFALPQDKK
ncbi:MAG: hypothetical protein K5634_01685 [Sphaerochaetaceae bacterium]|nr:hypothetical protein [Sphaerochaetaceae bacterium]